MSMVTEEEANKTVFAQSPNHKKSFKSTGAAKWQRTITSLRILKHQGTSIEFWMKHRVCHLPASHYNKNEQTSTKYSK